MNTLRYSQTVFIHADDPQGTYYPVKTIYKFPAPTHEACRTCYRDALIVIGTSIVRGLDDYTVHAVKRCTRCGAYTVFVFHLEFEEVELTTDGTKQRLADS